MITDWYALSSLNVISTVNGGEDVWRPVPFHVEGLHPQASQALTSGLEAAARSVGTSSPIGVVLEGTAGSGKTHLMSWLREQVIRRDGYFFLMSVLDARNFWESALVSIQDGLARVGADEESQLKRFLRNLTEPMSLPRRTQQAVIGNQPLEKEHLKEFLQGLYKRDSKLFMQAQDTARALVLLAANDYNLASLGDSYMYGLEDFEGDRREWGFRQAMRTPQELVRDISGLLALTGPSVMAFDQLDPLISSMALFGDGVVDPRTRATALQIAHGLTSLREVTSRTLSVVSCLPDTWILLRQLSVTSFKDRFEQTTILKRVPSPEVGQELVIRRLAEHFKGIGFEPPYPTWPVRPEAFAEAPFYTPRVILRALTEHIKACVARGEVKELFRFDGVETHQVEPVTAIQTTLSEVHGIETKFALLEDAAHVTGALDATQEDAVLPGLLAAGLQAWAIEKGDDTTTYKVDPTFGQKTSLHARLRQVLDEAREDEIHWAIRGISAKHPNAALTRLKRAAIAAGLEAETPKRRLIVLRNVPWAAGPKTQQALADFRARGGRIVTVDEDDLKSLSALRDLMAQNPPSLNKWLVLKRPASAIKLLRDVLEDWSDEPQAAAPQVPHVPKAPEGDILEEPPALPTREAGSSGHSPVTLIEPVVLPAKAPTLIVGRSYERGLPVSVELEALRKHTAIFAGSGSGKTVLIRRIIEECALQGVSSIVLDTNNDLARLGDAWPEEPSAWGPGDAARAARYIADTDVVVWTPRREKGRPLAFQPLPDFTSVRNDVDEFNEAVDAAVAALVPRAKAEGNTSKAAVSRAVLKEAVVHFGRYKSGGLNGLIGLLADFPEDISQISGAVKIADGLAQVLRAAMVNDPLFGGEGQPVDPGRLLTPAAGKRARVSVISFVGLQSDSERQSFVNQLQMALFAWIKKNPAGDRPLGGLFVMDEAQNFAPSGATTVCTQSTLALASQARKYGLGLVFATQAPKGLHNRIPGNAATQFYGLLNAQVQIEAAKEMARVKGGSADDIGALRSGQFYVAPEGAGFAKVRTPLCLSHHPRAPLTTEEVIDRASR
ncbi:ATP-binding protein [Herbidospora galbida]|uniref:ATP-binding protein n=1 Tax=Herbidospora galbida TaxID=2575442 RepID=A0A4U3MLL2_9ACTN|nr:DUF87 domain-containing protein [Herbidospora galbida]TKK88977.1 ATP-binding protein [Herbidospora galbida]